MTSFSQHLCHPLLFHSISIFAGAEDLNVNNIHSFKRTKVVYWLSRSFQQIDVSNKILMITIDQRNGDEAADGLWQVVWRDPAGLTDRCHARSRTHAHLVTVHNDHPDAHKDHTTEQCNVQFALEFCFWKHVAILPKAWPPRFLSSPECCLSFFWKVLVLVELEVLRNSGFVSHFQLLSNDKAWELQSL